MLLLLWYDSTKAIWLRLPLLVAKFSAHDPGSGLIPICVEVLTFLLWGLLASYVMSRDTFTQGCWNTLWIWDISDNYFNQNAIFLKLPLSDGICRFTKLIGSEPRSC